MEININITTSLNELIGTIILKVLEYNNINLTKDETEKMINYLLNDEEVKEAMKNIGK